MDCEKCGTTLPEGGNFCANCGAPRSVAAPDPPRAEPCRQCTEDVEIGAAFCWNCGVEGPHEAPAVTGNTVVREAPPEEPEGFEWDDAPDDQAQTPTSSEPEPEPGQTIRRGSGSPPLVPSEPTEPTPVGSGLPPNSRAAAMQTSFEEHDEEEPPTEPRRVVTLIEEELEGAEDDHGAPPTEGSPGEGSEPLALESEVDLSVAEPAKVWPNIADEVAELQLLMMRGFEDEAKDAWRLLNDAHPHHPDLIEVGRELGVGNPLLGIDPSKPPEPVDTTLVARRVEPDDAEPTPPVETPSSPTYVEGTAPPPGGFSPTRVEPNTTPSLGLTSPLRGHGGSSESMPTNPRLSVADLQQATASAVSGIRVVMLGVRGQSVWERVVPLGESMEVGRDPSQPWGDDPHIEPAHVRLHATAEGMRVEPLGHAAVYRQVDERLEVRDGDEYRVGESILRYVADDSGWGSLAWFPLSGETSYTMKVGGSGVMVGRDDADIQIPEDTFVSGAHCRFSCRDDRLYVEDLGSANGTYSRIRPGESVPFGGLVLVGQTQFKLRRES